MPHALTLTLTATERRPSLLPGIGLSIFVTLLAEAGERVERLVFGRAYLEALVLAIILGALWTTISPPGERFRAGIGFSGKMLLEVAVVLLGASISAEAIAGAGPLLILSIGCVVLLAIAVSFAVGRLLGLNNRVAALVAVGNSICGNSAIAAVAPVIGAEAKEIGSSIAFTAVLGVVVVLALPHIGELIGLDPRQYGIFAGLTVYAVPQVLAATAPVSALSLQVGTLTKLVRVLMLGPVIFGIALIGRTNGPTRPRIEHLLPWFIVGFLFLMGLRSFNLIPMPLLSPMGQLSNGLTVVSMAALGLSVDLRAVARSGTRVITAAAISLLLLGGLAFGVIRALGVA
ncbi:MAG TPA: putative sulfate exporter family transporter [Devosiaceae bacterium]|nr:putative sulfate exporter family transporter [Devosiaceae bacterium]